MLMLSACGGVNVQTELGSGADLAKLGSFGWLEQGDVSLDGVEAKKGNTVREYDEGIIFLDVLDPTTHAILWRGRGADRLLQGMEKDDAALYVNRLVKNILKTLPEVKK